MVVEDLHLLQPNLYLLHLFFLVTLGTNIGFHQAIINKRKICYFGMLGEVELTAENQRQKY
jgi:hypothetical protein